GRLARLGKAGRHVNRDDRVAALGHLLVQPVESRRVGRCGGHRRAIPQGVDQLLVGDLDLLGDLVADPDLDLRDRHAPLPRQIRGKACGRVGDYSYTAVHGKETNAYHPDGRNSAATTAAGRALSGRVSTVTRDP